MHEFEWRTETVPHWQFGTTRRTHEELTELPRLVARVVHPDYQDPSSWFSLEIFRKLFHPAVALAIYNTLQSDNVIERAKSTISVMMDCV